MNIQFDLKKNRSKESSRSRDYYSRERSSSGRMRLSRLITPTKFNFEADLSQQQRVMTDETAKSLLTNPAPGFNRSFLGFDK